MEALIDQNVTEERQPYGYAFSLLIVEGKDDPDVVNILIEEMNLTKNEASNKSLILSQLVYSYHRKPLWCVGL
jgi:hypothetical protein